MRIKIRNSRFALQLRPIDSLELQQKLPETTMEKDHKMNSTTILLSSVISSVISTTLTNPFEVAKLNLQCYPSTYSCSVTSSNDAPTSLNFRESLGTRYGAYFEGSVRSLKVAIPQATLTNILYMTLYEDQRHRMTHKYKWSSTSATILSTVLARFVVSLALLPLEVIRVRLSNSIKQEQGQYLKGLKATLIRDVIHSTLFWLTFEKVRDWYVGGDYRQRNRKEQSLKSVLENNLLPSLFAGSAVITLTTPLDTVKTRIQSGQTSSESVLREMAGIYRNEGVIALFSGFQFRLLKSASYTSIYMVLFEYCISAMQRAE